MVVKYELVGIVVVGVKHTTMNTFAIATIFEADNIVIFWLDFGYFCRNISGVSLDNAKLLI